MNRLLFVAGLTALALSGAVRAQARVAGDFAPAAEIDDTTMPPTFVAGGNGDVDIGDVVLLLRVSVELNQLVDLESQAIADLETQVADLQARIAELESLLVHFSREGDEVTIAGANLNVTNGLGSTDSTNGLGNVVVGYNEPRGFLADDRSGSHVLVVGSRNNFSSYGGLVVGDSNEASAAWATVAGGTSNEASGFASSVTGGEGNLAEGRGSVVSGGTGNAALATHSTVAAGSANEASGEGSAVTGGLGNTAEAPNATVGGGIVNRAIADGSTVSGGESRIAADESEWVAGSLSEPD